MSAASASGTRRADFGVSESAPISLIFANYSLLAAELGVASDSKKSEDGGKRQDFHDRIECLFGCGRPGDDDVT